MILNVLPDRRCSPDERTGLLARTMVEDAIGRRLEITVWRNGALVDDFSVPVELTDA